MVHLALQLLTLETLAEEQENTARKALTNEEARAKQRKELLERLAPLTAQHQVTPSGQTHSSLQTA